MGFSATFAESGVFSPSAGFAVSVGATAAVSCGTLSGAFSRFSANASAICAPRSSCAALCAASSARRMRSLRPFSRAHESLIDRSCQERLMRIKGVC